MSSFPYFSKVQGPAIKCRQVTEASIRQYKDKLPAALIEFWQENGWCGYGDGLLWVTNPADFDDVLDEWPEAPDNAIVFARTAFGDLFLWNDDSAYRLDVLYHKVNDLTDDIDIFFNYIFCSDDYLDKGLARKLYRKALKRLGQPDYDECYAFEPALALGGPGTVDTLRKVKLREHLSLLAQLRDE
jgi:hypothetical protein